MTCQESGKQNVDTRYFQLISSELRIVYKEELKRAAGFEKCKQSPTLSLDGCFVLGLAKAENALLVTTGGELVKLKDVRIRHVEI